MMVVMCFPSRSDRMIEPSLALRLPMLVQYRCPAAASMANPSVSFLPSSRMTFKFEPSGFTDMIRPDATSRKKRRPATALSRLGPSVGFETFALRWGSFDLLRVTLQLLLAQLQACIHQQLLL